MSVVAASPSLGESEQGVCCYGVRDIKRSREASTKVCIFVSTQPVYIAIFLPQDARR